MKKQRCKETRIVSILRQQEGDRTTKKLARENHISGATIYNWKSKYCGIEASDVKKLKYLEKENSRLKKIYADVSMIQSDNERFVLKKRLAPATK